MSDKANPDACRALDGQPNPGAATGVAPPASGSAAFDATQYVRDLLTPAKYVVWQGARRALIPGDHCCCCGETGYALMAGAPTVRGHLRTTPGCVVCRRDPLQWTISVILAKIVAGEIRKNPNLGLSTPS